MTMNPVSVSMVLTRMWSSHWVTSQRRAKRRSWALQSWTNSWTGWSRTRPTTRGSLTGLRSALLFYFRLYFHLVPFMMFLMRLRSCVSCTWPHILNFILMTSAVRISGRFSKVRWGQVIFRHKHKTKCKQSSRSLEYITNVINSNVWMFTGSYIMLLLHVSF